MVVLCSWEEVGSRAVFYVTGPLLIRNVFTHAQRDVIRRGNCPILGTADVALRSAFHRLEVKWFDKLNRSLHV